MEQQQKEYEPQNTNELMRLYLDWENRSKKCLKDIFQLQQEANQFISSFTSSNNNNNTIILEDRSFIDYFLNININQDLLRQQQKEEESKQNENKHKKKKKISSPTTTIDSSIENEMNFSWIDSQMKDVWPNIVFRQFISSINDLKNIRLVCTQFRKFIDYLSNIHFQFDLTSYHKVFPILISSLKHQFPNISSFYLDGNMDFFNRSNCLKLISFLPDYSTNITIRNLIDIEDYDVLECLITTEIFGNVKNMNNLVSLSLSFCSIKLDILTILPSSLTYLELDGVNLDIKESEEFNWSFSTPNLEYLNIYGYDVWDLSKLNELPPNLSKLNISLAKMNSELICSSIGLTSLELLWISWINEEQSVIDLSKCTNMKSLHYLNCDKSVIIPTSIEKLTIQCDLIEMNGCSILHDLHTFNTGDESSDLNQLKDETPIISSTLNWVLMGKTSIIPSTLLHLTCGGSTISIGKEFVDKFSNLQSFTCYYPDELTISSPFPPNMKSLDLTLNEKHYDLLKDIVSFFPPSLESIEIYGIELTSIEGVKLINDLENWLKVNDKPHIQRKVKLNDTRSNDKNKFKIE